MVEKSIDLKEYGLEGQKVVLQSVPWGAYKKFQKATEQDKTSMDPSNEMLLTAIKNAPWPHATIDDLDKWPGEVVLGVTVEMEEMLRPFVEKQMRRLNSGSKTPIAEETPKTSN